MTAHKQETKTDYFASFPIFKEERAQKFTTLVLTLVALSVFGLFAINPTASTIAELRKKIDDSQLVLNKLLAKKEALTVLGQKYQELQPDIPVVEKAIPKKPEVPDLIGDVQQIANTAGIHVDNIQAYQVDLVNQSNTFKNGSFAFTLSASGSQDNINHFLESLVHFQRIVSLESVSETRNTTDLNKLSLSVRGNAYFLK